MYEGKEILRQRDCLDSERKKEKIKIQKQIVQNQKSKKEFNKETHTKMFKTLDDLKGRQIDR